MKLVLRRCCCWANFKICFIHLSLFSSLFSSYFPFSLSHSLFYTCNQLKISFHISSYFDHFILVTHIFSATAAKKNDRKFSFHVFIVFSYIEGIFLFSSRFDQRFADKFHWVILTLLQFTFAVWEKDLLHSLSYSWASWTYTLIFELIGHAHLTMPSFLK